MNNFDWIKNLDISINLTLLTPCNFVVSSMFQKKLEFNKIFLWFFKTTFYNVQYTARHSLAPVKI